MRGGLSPAAETRLNISSSQRATGRVRFVLESSMAFSIPGGDAPKEIDLPLVVEQILT